MALNRGDIAIVQYNADDPDNFAFVALVDIPAGEVITFTDSGWLAAGGFRANEGAVSYTVPAGGIAAGTVVGFTAPPSGDWSAANDANVGTSGFALAAGGDQIIAFTGPSSSPTVIFALNNEGASVFQADATSSNTSALPTGLTLGTDAVALAEIDNARYTGTTTGTRAELLAAIANPANWAGDDAASQTGPSGFTVSAGAPALVINEVDADTPGTDAAEFVELFDGGAGSTALDGYVLVFFNGNGDTSYAAFDLDGYMTDADGYFLAGNTGVTGVDLVFAGNFLQNGADAVALYQGDASDFPNGTAVTATDLVDAIVYDTADADDAGLLAGLGQATQYDEDANGDKDNQSNSRVPNGSGGFVAQAPTPGAANAASGPALTVAIDPAAISENGGTATGTVTRSGPTTGDLLVSLASSDTSEATVPASVTIPDGAASASFAVTAADDSVTDGTQSVTVTGSAAGFADGSGTLDVTDDDVVLTRIHTIQGSPATQISGGSPFEGQSVVVQGIVTGVYPALGGFFVQEEDADADADALTSEGIFVFLGSAPAVAEGDLVTVTGAVDEFFGMTQIDNDNGDLSVVTVSSANPLPIAAGIDRSAHGANNDAAALEQFEGMRVSFQETLTVSEYFQLARFGEVVLYEGGRPYQYTQLNAPSVAGYAAHLADLATRRIILDDDNNIQNEPISTVPNGTYFHPQPGGFGTGTQGIDHFRGGDTVAGLTGIMEWSFSNWRVRPTEADPVTFTPVNTRADNAAPQDVGGSLKVASFNVLNYFATIDDGVGTSGPSGLEPRGADSAAEFARQTEKLVDALSLIGADIFGLVEIENDTGASAQALVDALNAEVGAGTYDFVDTGFIGTDAIKVGFLYNTRTVNLVGDFEILDSADDARFIDTANRPALAQTFEETGSGETFTAVVNHFKSKGSVTGTDADTGDGQGNNPNVRADAADALVDWLATDPTGSGDPDFLVLGDLNAYAMEDAVTQVRQGADDTAGTGDDFTDLAQHFNGTSAYSYLFDGQLGTLDYALASQPLLAQVTGVTEWHVNADEVPLFDYNDAVLDAAGEASFEEESDANPLYEANAFRTSDHDPIILGLNLGTGSGPNLVQGTPGRDILRGTDGDDLFQGMGGTDVIATGAGMDEIDLAGLYGNGQRDHTVVRDFDPASDILGGIGSDDVARAYAVGSRSLVYLDDGDFLMLYGVSDPDSIVFENDLLAV